jgi:heme exporter protein D
MKEVEIYVWAISYIFLIALVIHSEIQEEKSRKKRTKILDKIKKVLQ